MDEKKWHVLPAVIATAIMSFCGVLIETAMNVTFPTLMEEFSTTASGIQWVTTGYLLAIAIVVPISAYLVRNFTIRQLFLASNLIFMLGVLINCFSTTLPILLFGRFLQGVGTGIALPLMFHIVLTQVPLEKQGTIIGIGSMTTALAPPIGPTFGGLVSATLGWRFIYWTLIPCLLIALVIGLWAIPREDSPEKSPFNVPAFILLAICLASLLMAIEHLSLIGLIVVVISAVGFAIANRRNALLSFAPFKNWNFNGTLYIVLVFQATVLGLSFVYPNYLQLGLAQTATAAGLFMFPGATMVALLAPVSGKWFDVKGPLRPLVTGLVLATVGSVLISLLFEHLSILQLLALNVIFMSGNGFVMGSNVTFCLMQLDKDVQADGNSIVNTLQQFTGAISTTVVARIFSANTDNYAMAGKYGLIFITTLVVIALVVFGLIYKNSRKPQEV